MSDFFNEKGEVKIILGKGYISLYEAANLKQGNIFRVDRFAGEPALLYFNNQFLCTGNVGLFNNEYFGFIVRDFEYDINDYFKGAKDNIVEKLSTELLLDTVKLSINDLNGITIGSVIGLEKQYKKEMEIELIVAGIPLARGIYTCINEYLGIRITNVYNKSTNKYQVGSSGYKYNNNSQDYKITGFNFDMPDWFTWQTFARIKEIHNLFIENIKSMIPEAGNIKLLSSDQLAFYEGFDHVNKDDISYIILETDFNSSSGSMFRGNSRLRNTGLNNPDAKSVVFQENTKNPESGNKELSNMMKDRYFQMYQNKMKIHYPMMIHYKKSSPFSWLKDENSVNEFLIPSLKNAWKSITGLNLKYQKMTDDFNEYKVIPDNEMILIVVIGEEHSSEKGFITLVYPKLTLDPVIPLLNK